MLNPNQLPNGKIQNIYSPKPYRTGAYIQNAKNGLWFYTAKPEDYQYGGNYKFHQIPEHLISQHTSHVTNN